MINGNTYIKRCEAWAITRTTERKVRNLEKKNWKKISGSVFDTDTDNWRKRCNRELQEPMGMGPIDYFIKS